MAKEKGSPLILTCKHCLKTQERSLNDVFAENGILNLIFLIGMIIGTIIIANFLLKYLDKGGIYSLFVLPIGIAIPSLIYFVWLIEEKKKIRSFNKFRK
ncbi:hypothetical protein [Aquimarina latercula]|uniref:hypothetical protein n=1 Tax=Aquimarina latercula TaxID=987 RepID=UPI0012DD27A8|nr:hypothetical protein [Aquimarina latercula]